MSPNLWSRRLARGWILACGLCLAAAASADAPEAKKSPSLDLLGDRLPGQEAVASLKHVLAVPTASTRWRGLPAFGRDLFRGTEARFAPIEDVPVGPDYTLGPGDNLLVFVSGFSDTSFALTLDREGKVFLPRVGTTFLWGLSFADAEALIKARLGTMLRNARVQVSMGRVRTLDVFVLGAVARPGKITLTGLGTAFNALYAAGGPDSLGSLRDIRVMRADREVARLDLYPFLLGGDRQSDARLQNGDVVFVGFSRTLVGIQGAVARPAVYESEGPVTLRTLMNMAGGASPFADLSRIHIERVDPNGGFRLQDLPLDHGHGIDPDSLTLSNYDLVTILPLNERVRNVVTMDGYVRHPGEYELTSGLKLSQLVSADRLLPEAALAEAELRRVDPTTFQVEVRPFSIKGAWAGTEDVTLQPLDAVTVFSSARFPHSVTLAGEVVRPGTYTIAPGERLSDVLKRAGGLTTQGYLPAAVFIRDRAAERERKFLNEFVERQRLELAQQQARLAETSDTTATQQLASAHAALTAALENQSEPGRVVLDLDPEMRWVGTVKDPVLEGGDRLIVSPRPATVTVLGSVMNPGTVLARKNASFKDYVKLAGGVSHQGDLKRSYVLRANGAAVPKSSVSRVEAGDAIIVPPREVGNHGLGRNLAGGGRFLMELATVTALVLAAVK